MFFNTNFIIVKKVLYSSAFLVVCFILTSCDYVENPYPVVNANISDTVSCPAPVFPILVNHVKKILIEDFTGHTCGNCPKAAKELYDIDTIYPGRIIGLGIHVGSYAEPAPGFNGSPSTAFTSDYRTATGDVYDATFGASAFGLPQGMFNRRDYDASSSQLQFYPNWKAYAAGIIADASVVDLQINIDYTNADRKICATVRDSFLTAMSGTFKLVVLLTQDSIIDWQNYIGVNKSDYIHRHVLS